MTLHILRGVSGSGKTTYANTLEGYKISRDAIRAELTGRLEKFAGDNAFERKVTKIEEGRVRDALIARKDVVIDDTNLHAKTIRNWMNLANDYGTPYELHTLNVTLETAQEQNGQRRDYVPFEVIERQFRRAYLGPVEPDANRPFVDWSPYVPDASLPKAVGVDLDGTLSLLADGYSPYDPAHYPHDTPNYPVVETVGALHAHGYDLIVFTGRDEKHRDVCAWWLNRHGIPYDELIMRPEGDNRRDDVVKADLFNRYVRYRYDFLFQLDDRTRVVQMFRTRGIPTFQVANGDF